MRWATDSTATQGVDRRPVGLRARSAAGVLLFCPLFSPSSGVLLGCASTRVASRCVSSGVTHLIRHPIPHGRSLASFLLHFSPRCRAPSFLLSSSPSFLLGRGGSVTF
jgi:hypothetical protein